MKTKEEELITKIWLKYKSFHRSESNVVINLRLDKALREIADLSFKEGSKQTLKDELEFLKMEIEDIKQFKRDFNSEGYEILDFIQDFINVRQERIDERKAQIEKKLGVGE
jgi:vacuolar-type H+-ATPase subunit I/STV1